MSFISRYIELIHSSNDIFPMPKLYIKNLKKKQTLTRLTQQQPFKNVESNINN